MTETELLRTQAARGELSPRQTIIKSFDALDAASMALKYGLAWNRPEEISRNTLKNAAFQARLAADLLDALAEGK